MKSTLTRAAAGLLAATAVTAHAAPAALSSQLLTLDMEAESGQLLQNRAFWPQADSLVSDESRGLFLLDAKGATLSHLPGTFSAIDHRADESGLLVALFDEDRQQALVARLDGADRQWRPAVPVPRPDYKIDGLCLHRDSGGDDYLFLVGEEGLGEQWLVARDAQPLDTPHRVRNLSLPPQSEYCRVDDAFERLYVNEETIGLWAYPAHPEADLSRQPVDLVAPFGDIEESLAAIAVLPAAGVLALDKESGLLYRYQYRDEGWQEQPPLSLAGLVEPERLGARVDDEGLSLLLRDDTGLHRATLAWQPRAIEAPGTLPVLPAAVQTEPVPSLGDAADDPAVWVHPEQPENSRILGTDKQGGLLSYDLSGRQVQSLPVGRLNNVDLRAGFPLGDTRVDLAVASNRDRNSLHFFAIDRSSGQLTDLGDIATELTEIYGFCMFRDSRDNSFYAIPNDKDGTFVQYRISAPEGKMQAREVRRFAVDSQPEGCVADDVSQRLFVGEEDVAVWALDARADAPASLEKVITADGDPVHDDIEGLGIWRREDKAYLVISSQGNNSYVIVEAAPPYTVRGAVRIGANAAEGIDGASETDGLEASGADLGGIWSEGLLVVQDGRKRMPEGRQNYKLLPWSALAGALGL